MGITDGDGQYNGYDVGTNKHKDRLILQNNIVSEVRDADLGPSDDVGEGIRSATRRRQSASQGRTVYEMMEDLETYGKLASIQSLIHTMTNSRRPSKPPGAAGFTFGRGYK
jgi:hypothetical protein